MTYHLVITNRYSDPTYVNGLKTWKEVTDYLKSKLPTRAIHVIIYKYSSNTKLLGKKNVMMCDLYEVATSETDKILL